MAGYPITNETNLSILKTAKLLQALVDVAGTEGGSTNGNNNNRPKLPKSIELCVAKALSVQKELVKEIDKYMHSYDGEVEDIEVVRSIVETCPEFLATQDFNESLPIHYFADSKIEEAVCEYVPLLAEIGRKHGIGGEEGRGGLVIKNNNRCNALQCLTAQKSSNVMEKLKCAEPPLLLKEDVRNYELLHRAVTDESTEMVKYMVQLDPSCLYYKHSEYGIPLREVYPPDEISEESKKTCLKIMEYLLHEAVSYNSTDTTIGGLFAKDGDDELILNSLIETYGAEDIWPRIKKALSSFADIPILHKVIEHSPQNVQHVITQFPDSVLSRDLQNRLAVHVALECGMEWSSELVLMMNANRDQLKDIDPVTKWPPFVLAALDETVSCDLSTVYYLLRQNPEHGQIFLNKMRKKCNLENGDSAANKRRKTNSN